MREVLRSNAETRKLLLRAGGEPGLREIRTELMLTAEAVNANSADVRAAAAAMAVLRAESDPAPPARLPRPRRAGQPPLMAVVSRA
jgi:hypothetical protein